MQAQEGSHDSADSNCIKKMYVVDGLQAWTRLVLDMLQAWRRLVLHVLGCLCLHLQLLCHSWIHQSYLAAAYVSVWGLRLTLDELGSIVTPATALKLWQKDVQHQMNPRYV